MLKKLIVVLAILVVVVGAGFGYVSYQVDRYLAQPLQVTENQLVTIPFGANINRSMDILEKNQWIEKSVVERFVRRLHPELVSIKAGTYQVTPSMTLRAALERFISGKEHQFAVTFVEGSRFSDWRAILENTEYLEHTIDGESEEAIAKQLGIEHKKLEGLFLAETYHFTAGQSDLDILRRAHDKLMAYLNAQWPERDQPLPIDSPYQALTLASIIEKETALDSERHRVASVFVNRLNKHMRLQTDPTVIYGMGDNYHGNIRKRDLHQATPYNTYVIRGLPPTPIAMVGKNAIEAALHPEKSQYLYFVASGDGGHVFSKTLTEHNRAVRAYLRQLRNRK
ncbi:endolytic transglycosylase MltG [Vibrio zhugei]|uniref:Endolytic murein transglycosylase n=1 Tax=Vibrio zhugei TaxID=2479546 RepID=A0ABV7C4N1_9VIBR|nr:endolytic transglycosylase MltG [Vibrio zhugei]